MRFWLLVLLASCSDHHDGVGDCAHPAATTYSCAPLDPALQDATTCVGGPVWSSAYVDGGLAHEMPHSLYADGCSATLPECSPFGYGARVVYCTSGSWAEPI